MYINGWHIDGFGIFSDYVGPSLGPGLTVLLGPNEAGKSTLLAFIRGTLFGFKDKRSASTTALYPPVPGYRYGGRLYLADGDDIFTVDRDAGRLRAQPTITLADGAPGDPSDLQRLLGGADETLFRTVFAFSLTELQNLDSMSDEHISDRIFSAGLKGAGQSAQAVLAYFDERAAALYRPRGKSTIGQLLADLRQNADDLAQAERAAEQYTDHRDAVDAGVSAVSAAQATARQLRSQKERLESLLALWPVWSEYRDAQLVLARDDDSRDRLQMASLAAGLALHRQRLADQPAAVERQRSAAAAATARLAELGADVTVDTLAELDVSLSARDQLRAWTDRLQTSERATIEARRAVDERATEYRALTDEHQRLLADRGMQAPPPASELDERTAILAGLRADLQDLRQTPASASRALGLARLGMVALALVLGGVGIWRLGAGDTLVGSLALLCAVAALTLAGLLHNAAGDKRRHQLEEHVATTCSHLGLSANVSWAELEILSANIASQRAARTAWDVASRDIEAIARRRDESQRRLDDANALAARASNEAEEIAREWRAWVAARRLPSNLTPQGVVDFFNAAERALEAERRRRDATADLALITSSIVEWETSARSLLALTDEVTGEPLLARFAEAQAQLAERTAAEETVRRCEQAITTRLGSGEQAAAVRRELASGLTTEWTAELAETLRQIEAAENEVVAAAGRQRDAVRQLHDLEASANVIDLATRRSEIIAALEQALQAWRQARVASSLMKSTLDEFVTTHQPHLLEQASSLFAIVTEGRYARIVAGTGGANYDIATVDRTGVLRVPRELSRGTAEQLYLCLRLALVDEFARQNVTLPVVMDDVLVNFDPVRATAMAHVLGDVAQRHQVLLFTCHPSTRDHVVDALGDSVTVVDLPTATRPNTATR